MKTRFSQNTKGLLKNSIIILIVLLNLSAVKAAAALDISVTTSPENLKPGDSAVFIISITNSDKTLTAKDVVINISKGNAPITLTEKGVVLGDIEAADTESSVFPFEVQTDAEQKMYSVNFKISYSETDIYRNVVLNITDPQKRAIFEISSVTKSKTKLVPGDDVTFNFLLRNQGSEGAKNVRIILIQNEQIFVTENMENGVYVGDFPAKTTQNVPINLMINPEIAKGQYEFTLQISYTDSQGTKQQGVNRTIGIEIREEKYMVDIDFNKNALNLGEATKLNFTITNSRNSSINDIVFSWSEETGIILPVYSDNTKYVQHLGAGESADLEYVVVVDANAQTGLYQLNLKLEFEAENGASKEINTAAGIFVGGETDFDVTVSESSGGYTSLFIANIGNNPALSATVKVPQQEGFRVTGSSSSIIGDLDKGDYTIVSFQISQAGITNRTGFEQRFPTEEIGKEAQRTPPQANNLKILIEYTDTLGARQSLEKSVATQSMTTQSMTLNANEGTSEDFTAMRDRFRQQQQGTSPTVIALVALPIVAVIGFVCYKKRERIKAFLKKKETKELIDKIKNLGKKRN